MYYSTTIVLACFAAHAAAHGVITRVNGANGVTMPGLSVKDGVPRDCPDPFCGAEDDTSIISDFELGTSTGGALGRTADGPVDAKRVVSQFMGGSAGGNNTKRQIPGLGDLLGGDIGGGDTSAFNPFGASDAGTPTPQGTSEDIIQKTAGQGATKGLPTCSDDGQIDMTFHQVNQDGAGVLNAQIDATSGGTDPNAFKEAKVTKDVPGSDFGISTAQTTDFPVRVQMPAGMTCKGEVAGAKNVCIVRVRNNAGAGPFGGSGAFTQSKQARKRAIAFNLKNKRFARSLQADQE